MYVINPDSEISLDEVLGSVHFQAHSQILKPVLIIIDRLKRDEDPEEVMG